uniref:Uncharacterized protein n=2 Tax=Clytia hemisphaerica TaxID=252671 RepID=A0A7M5XL75_9CNID
MSIIGMILPTVLLCGLYLSCTKRSCTMLKLPAIPSCEKFFNWKSTGYVFGWFIFQMVLSAIPLGKVVTGPVLADGKARQHCLNGLFQFAISMATIGGLVFYGKLPFKYLTVNYLSLITAAAIYSFIVSIVVYFASRNASPKEPSNGFFSDFMKGRAASPRIGNFDIKMYAFKTGAVSWMALNLIYSMSILRKDWRSNYSLLAVLATQGLYVLDKLCSEEQQLHTASMKSSKVGYFFSITNFLFIPFFCSMQVRYLVFRGTSLPVSYCVIPLLITASGLVILAQSRNQKFFFRTRKYDAIAAGWNYIITRNGKGILCDGWWSQLTHPNYFGDFLQAMGWALLCGTNNLLPWMNVLLRLPMLIARAEEDDKACKHKYGPAWTEYRQSAKSKIFPLIY